MRCLTANYLESHKEYFESQCKISYEELIRNVLTMGKKAEGLEIAPLQVVLKVKINIISIDHNKYKVNQFDQIKITGKCPKVYFLKEAEHYDIIYSKEQSNVDGFDELCEKYIEVVRLPENYDIQKPGEPFFVELTQNGKESP